jgi:orotate phosphoribosyltransferase
MMKVSTVASRDSLRTLIEKIGVLDGSQTPVRNRLGHPLDWLLYTPAFSLTAEGNRLSAESLLELLPRFGTTQLAAYGLTGLPLLVGTVLMGGGKYHGLMVRAGPKAYGSMRQIDGQINREEAVVIIDDSLVSGTSFYHAARALETCGLRVAGIACLVEFPDRGGRAWAESLGYRVEAVFDVWSDLRFRLQQPSPPTFMRAPSRLLPEQPPSSRSQTLPGLARDVAAALLHGTKLGSVPHMRGPDTSGGVFVSFRHVTTDVRIVRDGFFSVDTPAPPSAPAVAAATERCVVRAASQLRATKLENLKIGISCMSRPEQVPLSALDADHYGLVIRSKDRPWKVGAALPNTPERESEVQQYNECLRKAGMRASEPHDIYRYAVTKVIEAGQAWQPYGATVTQGTIPELGTHIRECLYTAIDGKPPDAAEGGVHAQLPWAVHGSSVSIYFRGRLTGVAINIGKSLAESLRIATERAWNDTRAAVAEHVCIHDCDVVVSLLHDPHALGAMSVDEVAAWFRPSEHLLVAATAAGSAAALPYFTCHHGWNAQKTAQLIMHKEGSGSTSRPVWTTYRTMSWLLTPSHIHRLSGGFPARTSKAQIDFTQQAESIAEYIISQAEGRCFPAYHYSPVADQQTGSGYAGRILFAVTALAEAAEVLHRPDFAHAATVMAQRVVDALRTGPDGITRLALTDLICGPAADCQALSLLATPTLPTAQETSVGGLFTRVRGLFQADGIISDEPSGLRLGSDQDILPGVALVAIAKYAKITGTDKLPRSLSEQLSWYRRRFRSYPMWTATSWLMQGWAAIWRLSPQPAYAEFVQEIAEWVLRRQLDKTGAFLTDLRDRGPGFNTAYLAEGIAEAWHLSRELENSPWSAKLEHSWTSAMQFMQTLLVMPEDQFCMPQSRRVIGGVRHSMYDSGMRIDYAAHMLRALLGGIRNAE